MACALIGTAPPGLAAVEALAGAPNRPAPNQPVPDQQARDRDADHPGQTSDGVPGEIAAQIPGLFQRPPVRTNQIKWPVAPGLTMTRWDEHDARGPIRAYLLTIDPTEPGLKLDYADAGPVSSTAPVLDILAGDGAVAGVNGDFYDIGDTGAPLGLGLARKRGLLHGRQFGWNSAFFIDKHGRPDIATLPMHTRFKQHPNFNVTNLNSPFVEPDGIGVYTRRWGRTAGYRVTNGQLRDVRMVSIRAGRVVASKKKLTKGQEIQGLQLIGRGAGAKDLARLKVGTRANLRWWLQGAPRMAITGNKILVRDGVVEVVDDRVMHPRTAIGIDEDTGEILILAIDGRQSFSRGYTMLELANQMIDLGADEALNLDGGGSTTVVAKKPNGVVAVVNSPSDGFQRSVANALEVTYTAR